MRTHQGATLKSEIDPKSEDFRSNSEHMRDLIENLRVKQASIAEGGGKRAVEKHLGRGKLLPRERVRRLLDPGTPFLELSALAGEVELNDTILAQSNFMDIDFASD